MRGRPVRAPHRKSALALAAVLWIAAGLLAGLTLAGEAATTMGYGAAAGFGLAAILVLVPRPADRIFPERPSPAAREDAVPTSAALTRAMAGYDQPDAALIEMLRLVAKSVGCRTALLLTESGGVLTVESPALVDGETLTGTPGSGFPTRESGPLRMALAAGTPLAAEADSTGPGAWPHLAAAHGIESAAIVPLNAADRQIGLIVVGSEGGTVAPAVLARLRRMAPAAGAAIGAMLRLRTLTRSRAEAVRSARFRSDYAAVVGHELRTPLTTVLGVLKTVTRPEMAPDNPDSRDLLEMAVGQGNRLRRLVEDMLAMSQMGSGGVPVQSELVDLDDLLDRAVGVVSGADELATVTVDTAIPPVVLDREHTRRVLVNLIANAVKYGAGSLIEVDASIDRDRLVLTVADHGPGLPPETAASAFDAFTQLQRTEVNAYGGVGLGLSVARGLVEAMGGTIRHAATEGGGATFTIRLPFKPHPGGGNGGAL